jgi:hypothetical protein
MDTQLCGRGKRWIEKNIIIHQRMIIPDELEVEFEDTKGVIRKYDKLIYLDFQNNCVNNLIRFTFSSRNIHYQREIYLYFSKQ